MKKFIFLFLSVLFFAFNAHYANAVEAPTGVTFIYINGSNNMSYNNRMKFKTNFERDVKKMHPEIMKKFQKDELINEHFLQNGKFVINEEPIAFYWGDRSLKNIEVIDKDLAAAKKYSPRIAHQARSIFAHCLHDAVWVQKNNNMADVLADLHSVVNREVENGNKVVLLGYSAGSFVVYQYYMNKSLSIEPAKFDLSRYGNEIQEIIMDNPVKPTCFDALVDAELIKYDQKIGKFMPDSNVEKFRKHYQNLDNVTDKSCFVNGTVKGLIGFASPARLFYSDLVDERTSLNNISRMMAKSIIENDVFYLTVNYSNDPFGFANADNFTLKNLKNHKHIANVDYSGKKGFIYNKSNNYVPRTFVTAHLAYWDTPKRFAKAIVKAFNEGYVNFYK